MTSGLAILAIGFLLGMRHATDPDHVIAVSTIVSRERSIVKAGWIGILWGIGHTVTIVVVGAAIILFGLAIPVRVGLTMEFSVGLMLILLGVLNLTAGHNVISIQTNNGASAALSLTMGAISRTAGSTADFSVQTGGTISTTTGAVNGILGGYATAYPPTDEREFLAFARGLRAQIFTRPSLTRSP